MKTRPQYRDRIISYTVWNVPADRNANLNGLARCRIDLGEPGIQRSRVLKLVKEAFAMIGGKRWNTAVAHRPQLAEIRGGIDPDARMVAHEDFSTAIRNSGAPSVVDRMGGNQLPGGEMDLVDDPGFGAWRDKEPCMLAIECHRFGVGRGAGACWQRHGCSQPGTGARVKHLQAVLLPVTGMFQHQQRSNRTGRPQHGLPAGDVLRGTRPAVSVEVEDGIAQNQQDVMSPRSHTGHIGAGGWSLIARDAPGHAHGIVNSCRQQVSGGIEQFDFGVHIPECVQRDADPVPGIQGEGKVVHGGCITQHGGPRSSARAESNEARVQVLRPGQGIVGGSTEGLGFMDGVHEKLHLVAPARPPDTRHLDRISPCGSRRNRLQQGTPGRHRCRGRGQCRSPGRAEGHLRAQAARPLHQHSEDAPARQRKCEPVDIRCTEDIGAHLAGL